MGPTDSETFGDYGVGSVGESWEKADRSERDTFGEFGVGSLGKSWYNDRPDYPPERSIESNVLDVLKSSELLPQNSFLNPVWTLLNFYFSVKSNGWMDLKRYNLAKYQDAGNFNYGILGAAVGYDLDTLLRAAGAAQILSGTSRVEWGGPWDLGPSSYGDDPSDQEQIQKGYWYYQERRFDLNRALRRGRDARPEPIIIRLRLQPRLTP